VHHGTMIHVERAHGDEVDVLDDDASAMVEMMRWLETDERKQTRASC